MLIVRELYAGYGLSEVLTGVNLEVKAGQVVKVKVLASRLRLAW